MTSLQEGLSCLDAVAQWGHSGASKIGDQVEVYIRQAPVRLAIPDRRGGNPRYLHLAAALTVEAYKSDDGDHRCTTRGYRYTVSDENLSELVSWHWHPESRFRGPHAHVRALGKGHLPTGRVTWEAIVGYLLGDHGVTPAKGDWAKVLAKSEQRHLQYRTWKDEPPEVG